MTSQDIFTASRFIATIAELVRTQGVSLEVGSDFAVFQRALRSQPERGALAPRFDPETNSLSESTALWILGRDPQGEVVHTQALRLIDLEGLTLARYLENRFRDFSPGSYRVNVEKSRYRSAPGSRSIAGTVCYHGELWLKMGYRGAGMTAVLARLALVMALLKWSPDFIFGFMFPLAACKGLAAREGYMHTEPGSLFWALPGGSEDLEAWTVWMGRDDIRHILEIPPQRLFQQLERSQRPSQRERAA